MDTDDTQKDTHGADPEPPGKPGVPRWVTVFLIVTAVLIALGVAVMVLGDGQHGPGRHLSSTVVGNVVPGAGRTAVSTPTGDTAGAGLRAPVADPR